MKPKENGDRGYIVVTVAVLSAALIALAALAIDAGVFFDTQTAAQRIADASSLAGAFSFVVSPSASQPSTARDTAISAAVNQSIRGEAIQPGEVDVDVDLENLRVTVTITRNDPTFLARVINFTDADIRARATAEASQNATGSGCAKPWMIPNTVLLPEGSNPCATCPGPDFDPALAAQLLISGGEITPFAITKRGEPFTVRPTTPANSLEPGQFYSIQITPDPGGDVYRETIVTCAREGVFCGACYRVESGNMVGPTGQGVRELIGDPPDTYNESGGCYDPGCRLTSPSLVVAPVWDICNSTDPGGCQTSNFCPDGKFDDSGANITIRVIGFAQIFVEGMQGPGVSARLIDVKACSASAGGGGGEESGDDSIGPFAVPVRLVRLQ